MTQPREQFLNLYQQLYGEPLSQTKQLLPIQCDECSRTRNDNPCENCGAYVPGEDGNE